MRQFGLIYDGVLANIYGGGPTGLSTATTNEYIRGADVPPVLSSESV
jgi:hypothetical protein